MEAHQDTSDESKLCLLKAADLFVFQDIFLIGPDLKISKQ